MSMEIFTVKYQIPKFGSENEYQDELKTMMVATGGGPNDAKAACKQHHPGCRVVAVISRVESLAGLETPKINKALETLKKKAKK